MINVQLPGHTSSFRLRERVKLPGPWGPPVFRGSRAYSLSLSLSLSGSGPHSVWEAEGCTRVKASYSLRPGGKALRVKRSLRTEEPAPSGSDPLLLSVWPSGRRSERRNLAGFESRLRSASHLWAVQSRKHTRLSRQSVECSIDRRTIQGCKGSRIETEHSRLILLAKKLS